jgi:hypothetical protein
VLFDRRLLDGIADGSITVTFRRWARAQVVAGRRYRTGEGLVEMDAVDIVDEVAIPEADVRAAGYETADALRGDLRGDPVRPVYRLRFHRVDEEDPRAVLAESAALDDVQRAELDRRLARLDRASAGGPWTAATLAIIAARPGVRAGDLAAELGREMLPFKRDVRKLKELGLTISLLVGYELSPRGEVYWGRR